jgi:hypothetical protein
VCVVLSLRCVRCRVARSRYSLVPHIVGVVSARHMVLREASFPHGPGGAVVFRHLLSVALVVQGTAVDANQLGQDLRSSAFGRVQLNRADLMASSNEAADVLIKSKHGAPGGGSSVGSHPSRRASSSCLCHDSYTWAGTEYRGCYMGGVQYDISSGVGGQHAACKIDADCDPGASGIDVPNVCMNHCAYADDGHCAPRRPPPPHESPPPWASPTPANDWMYVFATLSMLPLSSCAWHPHTHALRCANAPTRTRTVDQL